MQILSNGSIRICFRNNPDNVPSTLSEPNQARTVIFVPLPA